MTDAIDKREPTTPASPAAPNQQVRHYHVPLTPKQVLARLAEQPGVRAYEKHAAPHFAADLEEGDYTLELGSTDFRMHCGPPAARGQSGTGMLRMLSVVGKLTPSEQGTRIELRFAVHRPRWAWQRWIGFLALASLGLFWVIAGPGELAKKALLYGLSVLVVAPVLAHDLRRDDKHDEQRKTLLNLIEHVFGPMQLAETPIDEPYRKRLRERQPDDDESDDESDDDEDDAR
ncbi:hypothetical protein ACNOYE_39650 [Nannocystaceae bacterium ST9]